MSSYSDSNERTPGEFFRFALGFLGFVAGAGGMVVSSPGIALLGTAIFLLIALSFY